MATTYIDPETGDLAHDPAEVVPVRNVPLDVLLDALGSNYGWDG